MLLLKYPFPHVDELAEILNRLAPQEIGIVKSAALKLWQQWHQEGSLLLVRIDSIAQDGSLQLCAIGATVWLTDEAVTALSVATTDSRTQRVYQAAFFPHAWVMSASEIAIAHEKSKLNLMILHFWSAVEVSSAAFHPVFLQANVSFRDLHQGFGVQKLLQECPSQNVPFLLAAGMHIVHSTDGQVFDGLVWMEINAEGARANPGGTLSFLFFSPAWQLKLKPAVQRMLLLALRQLTDEEIAFALGCSRDYVRKLWTDAYGHILQVDALASIEAIDVRSKSISIANPKRGRERRRHALDFFRSNPHELRPGLYKKIPS